MKEQNMPKADFVTAIVLIVFGVAIVVLSIRMPHMEELGANPYSVPGIVPGFLGAIITFLSCILLGRSIRQHGHHLQLTRANVVVFCKDPSSRRIALTILLGTIYGIGLLGRIPYVLATVLYVFVFVTLFEYDYTQPFHAQRKTVFWALIQAVLVAGIVAAVFRYLFLVDLP